MSNSEEEFEVVEKMNRSIMQPGLRPPRNSIKPKLKKVLSVSHSGPKRGAKPEPSKEAFFSMPEMNRAKYGRNSSQNRHEIPSRKDRSTFVSSGEDSSGFSEEEEAYETHKSTSDYQEAAPSHLEASSFMQDSFFPPSCPVDIPPADSLNSTQRWDELTESEVGYRRREQKEQGSYFREFAISHLSRPVADPTNSITLLIIGDMVNPEDSAAIGGMLARSVNRTEVTGNCNRLPSLTTQTTILG